MPPFLLQVVVIVLQYFIIIFIIIIMFIIIIRFTSYLVFLFCCYRLLQNTIAFYRVQFLFTAVAHPPYR
eukprot:m.3103 g.3103  ORF g.3103 m.3103 type:complete len:69 (+) comp2016_c0_seq1:1375-1581(+)